MPRRGLLFAKFVVIFILIVIWFNCVAQAQNPFDKMKEIALSKGQEIGFMRSWGTVYGSSKYHIKYDEPSGMVMFQEEKGDESLMVSRFESGFKGRYDYSFARSKGGKIIDMHDVSEKAAIETVDDFLKFFQAQRLLIPDKDWTFYFMASKTPPLFSYYHKEGIIKPSPGTIRVWTKMVSASDINMSMVGDKTYDVIVKVLGESKGDFVVALWEIQYSNKMGRGLIAYECDKNGKWVQGHYGGEWEHLIPGTNLESLFKAVCP